MDRVLVVATFRVLGSSQAERTADPLPPSYIAGGIVELEGCP